MMTLNLNSKELRFNGALSDEYDLNLKVFPNQKRLFKLLGKQILNYCLISKIKNPYVLELGCGTGDTTKEVFACNPKLKISCLDSSKSMILQIKKNLKTQFNKNQVDFILDDATSFLQVTKNKYDIIFTAYLLHNIKKDERSALIKLIYNCLNKGGIFIELDVIYNENEKISNLQFSWLAKQLDKYVKLGRPDLQQKWLKHITEDRNPNRILLESKLINELKDTKFKSIECIERYHSDALYIAKK